MWTCYCSLQANNKWLSLHIKGTYTLNPATLYPGSYDRYGLWFRGCKVNTVCLIVCFCVRLANRNNCLCIGKIIVDFLQCNLNPNKQTECKQICLLRLILYPVWFAPHNTILSVICVSYMWISLRSGSLWPKTLPGVTSLQLPNWGNHALLTMY